MNKIGKFPWDMVAGTIVGSAAVVTIGAFVDAIIDWLKENRSQAKSKEYYEKMLEAQPSLQKQDPELVARYWASLYHFAPNMAHDPLAASAFIKQSLDRGYPELFGGPPVDVYNTLTNINKSFSDSRSKNRGIGTDIGVNAAGQLMGSSVNQVMDTYRKPVVKDQAVSAIRNLKREMNSNRQKDLKSSHKLIAQLKKTNSNSFAPKQRRVKTVGWNTDVI